MAPAKIDEACSKAAAGHYQLACAAAWEGKHGCACETGINHPNQVRARISGLRHVLVGIPPAWTVDPVLTCHPGVAAAQVL